MKEISRNGRKAIANNDYEGVIDAIQAGSSISTLISAAEKHSNEDLWLRLQMLDTHITLRLNSHNNKPVKIKQSERSTFRRYELFILSAGFLQAWKIAREFPHWFTDNKDSKRSCFQPIFEIARSFSSIMEGQGDAIRGFIDLGFDLNTHNDYGRTPLFESVFGNDPMGNADCTTPYEALVLYGASTNCACQDGNTALHAAAKNCDYKAALYLVQNGAALDKRNSRGHVPFDLIGKNSLEINYYIDSPEKQFIEPLKRLLSLR